MMTLTTTLARLRQHGACADRYAHLARYLGASWLDHHPIPLLIILDHNGVEDTLWALLTVPIEQEPVRDRLARLFLCWCVRYVWELLPDERSRAAVEVAERYAHGEATPAELEAARGEALHATLLDLKQELREEGEDEASIWQLGLAARAAYARVATMGAFGVAQPYLDVLSGSTSNPYQSARVAAQYLRPGVDVKAIMAAELRRRLEAAAES